MSEPFDPKKFISFISHNGKSILYVDYSQCKDKWEMIALVEATVPHYKNAPGKILSLSDYNNASPVLALFRYGNRSHLVFDRLSAVVFSPFVRVVFGSSQRPLFSGIVVLHHGFRPSSLVFSVLVQLAVVSMARPPWSSSF